MWGRATAGIHRAGQVNGVGYGTTGNHMGTQATGQGNIQVRAGGMGKAWGKNQVGERGRRGLAGQVALWKAGTTQVCTRLQVCEAQAGVSKENQSQINEG